MFRLSGATTQNLKISCFLRDFAVSWGCKALQARCTQRIHPLTPRRLAPKVCPTPKCSIIDSVEVRSFLVQTTLLSIPQFANVTGISEAPAHALFNRGDVSSVCVGARRRVDSRWAERWVNLGNPEITMPAPK